MNPTSAPAATSVYLTAAARTPITGVSRRAGADNTAPGADELAAPVLAELGATNAEEQPGLVILGQTVGTRGNTARRAALAAGLNIPGITIDAQCGSGLVAIGQAAQHVAATGQDVLVGGVEAVSHAGAPGLQQAPFTPAGHPDPNMTRAADRLAAELGISVERQGEYALESHRRALASPLYRPGQDTGPRQLTQALAARFQPLFADDYPDATVTALTAAGPADAAAAIRLSPRTTAGAPAIRILDWTLTPGDPLRPGLAPITAVNQLLAAQDLDLEEIAVIEIVEAYSSIVLATVDGLGIREGDERLNTLGGALAYGHPWAASGTIALQHAAHRLLTEEPPGGTAPLALITAAIAGGMGAAVLLERVDP